MTRERTFTRRTALATAGAVAATALTAALAVGANFGLFGLAGADSDDVGTFTPASTDDSTTSTTLPEVEVETR
ncbi:MAG TPA: hypothetical protein VGB03_02790, partial [Acidimicrobiales bacterium]